MVRCTRCGSGFSAFHSAAEISCPRCRIRDGVTSTFTTTNANDPTPTVCDSLSEMTRRVERGRARLGIDGLRASV